MEITIYKARSWTRKRTRYIIESPRTGKWIVLKSIGRYNCYSLSREEMYKDKELSISELKVTIDIKDIKKMHSNGLCFFDFAYDKKELPKIIMRYGGSVWMD